jgi:2-methylaconitate isomerase
MRGGTSKGVFFRKEDLPREPAERDRILLRVIGSPDPYGKQIDGMGAATSSTSKVVLLSKSERDDSDVDYLFGQVSIDKPSIDWSGNCGNLTSAVGPFAVAEGLVDAPRDGIAIVRIWQANIGKRIISHVPMRDGLVVEEGDFELDGVTFPAAEIRLEFLDPGAEASDEGAGGGMFPTGRLVDSLVVPGVGTFEASLVNAGIPTIFLEAASLGLRGDELQPEVNGNAALLERFEAVRVHGAVAMGLAKNPEESARRPHTPKLCFVSLARAYKASSGRMVAESEIDLLARIVSIGALHHAMTGTGAVALAVASAIPGTVVSRTARAGRAPGQVRFGHPSGTLTVGAEASSQGGEWSVTRAVLSRSARRLMEGWVRVPQE